jgi:hypothetical protein
VPPAGLGEGAVFRDEIGGRLNRRVDGEVGEIKKERPRGVIADVFLGFDSHAIGEILTGGTIGQRGDFPRREVAACRRSGGGAGEVEVKALTFRKMRVRSEMPFPNGRRLITGRAKNLGEGRFKDVSREMNLEHQGWSGDAAACDINEDGFPDLYVLNMQGDDRYYENQAGKRFIDRVINHFVNQVMEPQLAGRSDVHRGPFAHGFASFENGDRRSVISLFFVLQF